MVAMPNPNKPHRIAARIAQAERVVAIWREQDRERRREAARRGAATRKQNAAKGNQ